MRDIEASLNAKIPIVVVRGTPLTDQICDLIDAKDGSEEPRHQSDAPVWGATDEKV